MQKVKMFVVVAGMAMALACAGSKGAAPAAGANPCGGAENPCAAAAENPCGGEANPCAAGEPAAVETPAEAPAASE